MKKTNQKRTINLQRINSAIDAENQIVEIAFASETPVQREINGELLDEILLCSSDNVDLSRLNTGAPLLLEHDFNKQIGVVENARVDSDSVCRATVRISKTNKDAVTVFRMMQEGIKTKISVGYTILDYYISGNQIIVSHWQPYEISSVSVPADNEVGLARSLSTSTGNKKINKRVKALSTITNTNTNTTHKDVNKMDKNKNKFKREIEKDEDDLVLNDDVIDLELDAEDGYDDVEEQIDADLSDAEYIDVETESDVYAEDSDEVIFDEFDLEERSEDDEDSEELEDEEVLKAERKLRAAKEKRRQSEIRAIAKTYGVSARSAIQKGISVEQFKNAIRKHNKNKKTKTTTVQNKDVRTIMKTKNTVISNLVRSIANPQATAGMSRGDKGFKLDLNTLARAITPATNTITGAGVVSEVTADSYIAALLSRSVLGNLNPTIYSGLAYRGVLSIPRLTHLDDFQFYAEGDAVYDSTAHFDSIKLSPQMFAGSIPVTKQLSLSSESAERFVQDALINNSANGLEKEIFKKIQATVPVQETLVSGTITEKDVQAAIEKLGTANVDINYVAAVVHPSTLAKLRQTPVLDNTAGKAMVEGHRFEMWLNDEVRIFESTMVEKDTVVLGDFRNVLIAQWNDGQEIDVDTTTYRSSQITVFRSFQYIDTSIAHEDAFVKLVVKA